MRVGVILETFIFVLIFINEKIFSIGDLNEEKRHNFLHTKQCAVLCDKINVNSKSYLAYLNKIFNTIEQDSKKCALILNEIIDTNKTNNTSEKSKRVHKTKDLTDFTVSNTSIKLTVNKAIVPSSAPCRNLVNLLNNSRRILRIFQKIYGSAVRLCQEKKPTKTPEGTAVHCTKGNWRVGYNATPWLNVVKTMAMFNKSKKFNIINEESEYINISLTDGIKIGKIFLCYASYANSTSSRFECMKILRQNFTVYVTPNVNYLICLTRIDKYFQVNISDCQPFKTKPLRENQPWLSKKSIPVFIISIFVLFVLAMAIGASVLYLSVHKNPSLIRGSKRVIEVKRQDKAHILIMPRDYENVPLDDSPLALSITNHALEPAISTLSCDTVSTVSYVSANQPTPVEILRYRLNRLRELFQRNDNNIPMPFPMLLTQRLPPNVDLLFEYEWYTITTTTTTTEEKEAAE